VKTRIVAQRHQVVRLDRELRAGINARLTNRILRAVEQSLPNVDAVIVCDYGKGVVTQPLLNAIKPLCHQHGLWLSLDPKPVHEINLAGLSLVTPNRKEIFELARLSDETRHDNPLKDRNLMTAAKRALNELRPVILLVTLGEQGMLLCLRDEPPFHIPTFAREVFDVSGAGDAVIAAFTLGIAAGASPVEAAILANHVAGVVVGKVGTATASPEELLKSFNHRS
jgi:D-beta-D-heptose 7-phosphate kinase/D-beta-D-heptose 1-phosphate adenosyltransferase